MVVRGGATGGVRGCQRSARVVLELCYWVCLRGVGLTWIKTPTSTLVYAVAVVVEAIFGFNTQASPNICPVLSTPTVACHFPIPITSWRSERLPLYPPRIRSSGRREPSDISSSPRAPSCFWKWPLLLVTMPCFLCRLRTVLREGKGVSSMAEGALVACMLQEGIVVVSGCGCCCAWLWLWLWWWWW